MFEPVKIAFGEYLQGSYRDMVATTPTMKEFKSRGFAYCFAFAPSRMVDKAQEMLDAWQRNDTDQKPTTPPKFPVVLVGFAKDYSPTGREYTRQIVDELPVIIPEDPKQRYFKVKTVSADLRVQIAVISADEATAKSIFGQILLYIDSPTRRGFDAVYEFAKLQVRYPCQIETPDLVASNVEVGSNNVTMLVTDLNLHCTVPIYSAPSDDEPNDGKGTGKDDPSGYRVVDVITNDSNDIR